MTVFLLRATSSDLSRSLNRVMRLGGSVCLPIRFSSMFCGAASWNLHNTLSSPLHVACHKGDADTVLLCLSHGADPNIPSGRSLITALAHGHLDIARLLLLNGADPNKVVYVEKKLIGTNELLRSPDGALYDRLWNSYSCGDDTLSPLDVGCELWGEKAAKLLLDFGANPDPPNAAAMVSAMRKGNHALVNLLFRSGAGRNGESAARILVAALAKGDSRDIFPILLDRVEEGETERTLLARAARAARALVCSPVISSTAAPTFLISLLDLGLDPNCVVPGTMMPCAFYPTSCTRGWSLMTASRGLFGCTSSSSCWCAGLIRTDTRLPAYPLCVHIVTATTRRLKCSCPLCTVTAPPR